MKRSVSVIQQNYNRQIERKVIALLGRPDVQDIALHLPGSIKQRPIAIEYWTAHLART